MDYIDILFDGPPGPTAGRFVEVEDPDGNSISVGEWVERDDKYWALRIPRVPKGDAVFIQFGSIIGHLLEYIDTQELLDLSAAMASLQASNLPDYAENNEVLLPVRRDMKRQCERMREVV